MDTYEIIWIRGEYGRFNALLKDNITGEKIDSEWFVSEDAEAEVEAEKHFRKNGTLPQSIKPIHTHTNKGG